MLSFKQHCHAQRAFTSLSKEATEKQAIQEHKYILFNTHTPTEVVQYESELMQIKAKKLPENIIANKAYEASKLSRICNDTKAASCLLFNCFNELNRLDEMVSDADGKAGKLEKVKKSGTISYDSPEVIKKKLRKKAVKRLQEQNEQGESYDYKPIISNVLIEREALKIATITWLVRAVKQTNKSVKELHASLKKNVSKNQAVLSKIRKAKATGNDQDLLQLIAGVLGFQLSGKVQDVNIKKAL
jgi:hypothetical protein